MANWSKMIRILTHEGLYDAETKTVLNPISGREKKATLKNVRELYNDLRKSKGKKHVSYSITIVYDDLMRRTSDNRFVEELKNQELKFVRDEKMTVEEAKDELANYEVKLNLLESWKYHTLTFKSVSSLEMSGGEMKDTKMFHANYSISAKYISKWMNEKPNECVFEFLMKRYNNHRGLKLSKERIAKAVFSHLPLPDNFNWKETFSWGVSAFELKRFCKEFKVPMICLDITHSEYYRYDPECDPKSKRKTLAFITSNNHLYPIEKTENIMHFSNRRLNSLSVSKPKKERKSNTEVKYIDAIDLDEKLEKEFINEKKLPTFSRHRSGKNRGTVSSITWDGIRYKAVQDMPLIKQICKELKLEFKGQSISVIGTQLLEKMYKKFNRSVFAVDLRTMFKNNNKSAFCYTFREPPETCFKSIPKPEKKRRELKQLEIGNDLKLVEPITEKGKSLKLGDGIDRMLTLDINKCYTDILLKNKFPFPVFSVCDTIEEYDKKGIDRIGFYWVETENFFPLKGSGFYCYSTLVECKKRGISFAPKYQILASESLPCNFFVKFLREVLSLKLENVGKVETSKVKKQIVNMTIGTFNQWHGEFSNSRFTSDFNEANYFFFNKFGRGQQFKKNMSLFVSKKETKMGVLFEIEKRNRSENYESNIPIYQMIVETGWIRIFDVYKSLGGDLICVKTDSVTVLNPTSKKVKYDIEKDEFDISQLPEVGNRFGMLKKEPNPEKVRTWNKKEGKCDVELKDWDQTTEEDFASKYSVSNDFPWVKDIRDHILDQKCGRMIEGKAGTGKSVLIALLVKQLKKRNLKFALISPTHKASRNISLILGKYLDADEIKSVPTPKTIHEFLGVSRDHEIISEKHFKRIQTNNVIIIDEVGMISARLLSFLHLAKMRNKDLVFLCFGHSWQLPPVKEECHLDSNAIKFLCDFKKLNMTIIKRTEDKKLVQIAETYYKEKTIDFKCFNKIKTVEEARIKLFLCYTNKMRKLINAKLMERYKKKRKVMVLELDLKHEEKAVRDGLKTPYSQRMTLNEGMPIICRETCKKRKIYNNQEFLITGFDGRKCEITINHDDETLAVFSVDDFRKYFVPAYCITIHKAQGQTYTQKYGLCEFRKIHRSKEGRNLLYVALTRAKKLKQIYVLGDCHSSDFTMPYTDAFLSSRIKGYNEQDEESGGNNLTLRNVKHLIKSESNKCYFCHNELGVEVNQFSLDRVCSKFKHNIENCVLCCLPCNRKKRDRVVNTML